MMQEIATAEPMKFAFLPDGDRPPHRNEGCFPPRACGMILFSATITRTGEDKCLQAKSFLSNVCRPARDGEFGRES
jgi:hypothetical protein